jgi:hypothetical protein
MANTPVGRDELRTTLTAHFNTQPARAIQSGGSQRIQVRFISVPNCTGATDSGDFAGTASLVLFDQWSDVICLAPVSFSAETFCNPMVALDTRRYRVHEEGCKKFA